MHYIIKHDRQNKELAPPIGGAVWLRVVFRLAKESIVTFCDYSQFDKSKKTPVVNVQGMVKLLFLLIDFKFNN